MFLCRQPEPYGSGKGCAGPYSLRKPAVKFTHSSALLAAAAILLLGVASVVRADERPNIVWITAEDMSADLGCYGDEYADTPHLDRLARESVRYTRAFATAPVCSPARSCLITGMYATSLGTQRLRSAFPLPDHVVGFPSLLRRAGYYTTNNVKTDYNTSDERRLIDQSWDANGADADWRGRSADQPFFSVFNLMTTHQSRTGVWPREQFEREIAAQLPPSRRHDPDKASVPAFYPDTPLVRQTLARYHDCISVMDEQVGEILARLERDGLTDSTIVFFFSDHGMGLPRGKRVLHDSGMHVPLIVRFPARFRHLAPSAPGNVSRRLVSFVDFPPTVLNLTGAPVPDHMQGRPFLGKESQSAREYVYGARDRVDEAFDVARSVRDDRFLYLRNYMPHLSWMQPEWYSDQSEMRRQLREWKDAGKLGPDQLTYAADRRAVEELYDTTLDPQQTRNLAESVEHGEILSRMRRRLRRWILETQDLGFLTEPDARRRAGEETPWHVARDPSRYPLTRILETAEMVGHRSRVGAQAESLKDSDPAVRYWAAVGLHAAGREADRRVLREALTDDSAPVRIEAASALVGWDDADEPDDSRRALEILAKSLESDDVETVLHAARALQLLGPSARPALPAIRRSFQESRSMVSDEAHPCWLFVLFSADAALWTLEPDSTRERLRY